MNDSKPLLKDKLRAGLVHEALSVLVLLPVLALVFLVWFPAPWFEVQAAGPILALLSGIQLVGGPVLTLVVFKRGKAGLVLDLVVIGLLQAGALGYGAWVLQSERPSYVVFAVDRLVPLAQKDVDLRAAEASGAGDRPGRGPLYVFAEMPMGQAFERFQNEVLLGGMPDLERRPEFWRPFAAHVGAVQARSVPLKRLMAERPDREAEALAAKASDLGLDLATATYLPIPGKRDDFVGLLDPESARVLGVVPVDPWPSAP